VVGALINGTAGKKFRAGTRDRERVHQERRRLQPEIQRRIDDDFLQSLERRRQKLTGQRRAAGRDDNGYGTRIYCMLSDKNQAMRVSKGDAITVAGTFWTAGGVGIYFKPCSGR
jgi:hypothetical protein